ncbi:serine/threonine-protein kinase [Streptomyces sp. NPDC048723]|uniref:serine/threonine-protein kinase n=1 Tax=Streptomyces sp. NPDC048723 TaxID=3365589 RepID=UPI0037146B11
MRQVAQGLVELAEVSVLHRDLKPANVLDVGGRWQLADFGHSRDLLESTSTYTFRGLGTLPYMAPELWNGQPATVKSDLYAYGVLAYEVMAGTRPFCGAGEATLMRQHQQEAPPPLPDTVPAAVGRLVLRLLTKDPTGRPQDARAVVEALDAASRRLAPEQERLREAAFEAQQRRSDEDAVRAAQTVAQAAEQEQTAQALADLHHILEEAAALAREALPEVRFGKRDRDWHLAWHGVRVAVEVWAEARQLGPSAEDPCILAGAVYAAPADQAPSANIVCELREGRPGVLQSRVIL